MRPRWTRCLTDAGGNAIESGEAVDPESATHLGGASHLARWRGRSEEGAYTAERPARGRGRLALGERRVDKLGFGGALC